MYEHIKDLKLEKGIRRSLYLYALALTFIESVLPLIINEVFFILPFCITMALSVIIFVSLRKVRKIQKGQGEDVSYISLLKEYAIGSIILVGLNLVMLLSLMLAFLLFGMFGILGLIIALVLYSFLLVVIFPALKIIFMLYITDGFDVITSLKKAVQLMKQNISVVSRIMMKIFGANLLFYFIISLSSNAGILVYNLLILKAQMYFTLPQLLLIVIWLVFNAYLFSDALLGILCLYEKYENSK